MGFLLLLAWIVGMYALVRTLSQTDEEELTVAPVRVTPRGASFSRRPRVPSSPRARENVTHDTPNRTKARY